MNDGRLRIYGDSRLGICYKPKLLCAEMEMNYDWQEVDILAGDCFSTADIAIFV